MRCALGGPRSRCVSQKRNPTSGAQGVPTETRPDRAVYAPAWHLCWDVSARPAAGKGKAGVDKSTGKWEAMEVNCLPEGKQEPIGPDCNPQLFLGT